MADVFEDTASRLWWGIRRYFLILLITVPAGAAIFVSAGASGFGRSYEAEALVVVSKPVLTLTAYARFVEAVFAGGGVARRAVEDGKLPLDPSNVIPDHAELQPVEETIAFRVVGLHTNRRLAAQIATEVANALVAELNEISPDNVGVFAVQDTASVPNDTSDAVAGPPVLGVLGAAMGVLVGAAIVGMILTLRRPVLGAEEASALVGAPLAGAPTLPAKKGLPPPGSRVPGLAAVVKRLFPAPQGTIVLISPPGGEQARTILAQLISVAHSREAPTFLVTSRDENVRWLYEHLETDARVVVTGSLPDPATWTRVPIVIDGPSARGSDAPQMIPEMARIVLVVRQGVPRNRLLEVASQFLPGEIAAVLFVRRGNSWPWLMSPRTAPGADRLPSAPAGGTPTLSALPSQPKPAQPAPPVSTPSPAQPSPAVSTPSPAQPARPAGSVPSLLRTGERPRQQPSMPHRPVQPPLPERPRSDRPPVEIIDLDELKEREGDAVKPNDQPAE